jgi:hypothetical protein
MVHLFRDGYEAWSELEDVEVVRYGGRLIAVRGCLERGREGSIFV